MGGGGISKQTRSFLDPIGWAIGAHDNSTYNAIADPMSLFKQPEETEALPAVKKVDTKVADLEAAGDEAGKAETERLKKRKGYKSTVLTSMAGDLSAPTTLKQTLGGA